MAKRKTIEQLYADLELKEARMIRAFRAWHTARAKLINAGKRADKKLAGEAHIAQLVKANANAGSEDIGKRILQNMVDRLPRKE